MRLQAKLADPKLFARDHAAFKQTADELEAVQAAIVKGEEEWLTLEMIREEMEA